MESSESLGREVTGIKGDHESERVLDGQKHRGCADAAMAMQAIRTNNAMLSVAGRCLILKNIEMRSGPVPIVT